MPFWDETTPITPANLLHAPQRISTVEVSVAAPSVTFSAIPSGYVQLLLMGRVKTDSGGVQGLHVQMNGASGATDYAYQRTAWPGDGSGPLYSAGLQSWIRVADVTSVAAAGTTFEAVIANYANGVLHPTVMSSGFLSEGGAAADQRIFQCGGRWRSAAAVSSLTLSVDVGNLDVNTVFSLYGLT